MKQNQKSKSRQTFPVSTTNILETETENTVASIPIEVMFPETKTTQNETNMSTDTLPETQLDSPSVPAVEIAPDAPLTAEQTRTKVKEHTTEIERITAERDAALAPFEAGQKAERDAVIAPILERQKTDRDVFHKGFNDQLYTHKRFVDDLKAKVLKDIQAQQQAELKAHMAELGIDITVPAARAVSAGSGEKRTRTSSEEVESKILDACRAEAGMSLSDIEEATSLPYTTIQKNSAELVASGKLRDNGLERKAKRYFTV